MFLFVCGAVLFRAAPFFLEIMSKKNREDNLIWLKAGEDRTREIATRGGTASGAAARKRRAIRDTVEAFLYAGGNKAGESNIDLIFGNALMKKARGGDIRAMELITKISGELTATGGGESEVTAAPPPAKIDKIHYWLDWQFAAGGNYAFLYGTTRSGKTYAVCQWICENLARGKLTGQTLICGQTIPFLRNGCAAYLQTIAPQYGLTVMDGGLKVCGQHGQVLLQSFEKPERVLSAQWTFVFVNEGNVIPQPIIDGLSIRCAGLLLADFNPSASKWWGAGLMKPENSLFCTFRDNPFLGEPQRAAIEMIRERGETAPLGSYANWYYRVYYLGEFAEAGGGVFTTVRKADRATFYEVDLPTFHGIDFGDTADPNALAAVKIDNEAKVIHILCQYYQTATDDKTMTEVLIANNVEILVFETATGGNTRAKNFRIFGFRGKLIPCLKEQVAQSVFNLANYDIICYDDNSANEFHGYRLDAGRFRGADHIIDAVRYVANMVLTNRIRYEKN